MEHRLGLIDTGGFALRDPGEEVLQVDVGAGAARGAAQVLADLGGQLGGEVLGRSLRDPFPKGLERRPGGLFRGAPAGESSPLLDLTDEFVVRHDSPPVLVRYESALPRPGAPKSLGRCSSRAPG